MPLLILPENVARQDGIGESIALKSSAGKPLLLTLGITRILEQESLEVSLWGSKDCSNWGKLHVFPQKFYCGTYSLNLDLRRFPEIRYLRAQWRMNRWGHGAQAPLFGFYLMADEPRLHAVGAA
jgi:hypothetical protein